MLMVDDRVGSRELYPYLPSSTDKSLTRLDFADVAWIGNGPSGPVLVGVERKTVSDLVSCISDGRLSGHQLVGLLDNYYRVYILVEGIWRANPDSGVLEVHRGGGWRDLSLGKRRFMAREVGNYLNTLQVICGCGVWMTGGIKQSAMWVTDTYRWWQKQWTDHKSHRQFHTPNDRVQLTRPSLVCRVAKELSGVGWEKANGIGNVYKSVMELALADESGLRQVDGVGKKLAGNIVRELRGEGSDV